MQRPIRQVSALGLLALISASAAGQTTTAPATTAVSPFSISLGYYNARMRQSGQPPALNYGEGFMLVEVKWPSSFTEKDDVSYRVWIRGEERDWASANAPQGIDEAGARGWRQYAYTGNVREGASKGTRIKLEVGYRPAGLSSHPLKDVPGKGILPLPEAMPLSPGKHRFTVCAERTIAGGAKEVATQPLEITVNGEASAGAVSGIASNKVFQRTGTDKGNITLKLAALPSESKWKATVKREAATVGSANGTAKANAVDVAIRGVPVGGPYTVEVDAGGKTRTYDSVYVGDIWIISGQSNAVGCGFDQALGAKPMPGVQCLEPRYNILEWTVARDGLFQHTVGAWVTAAQHFYTETKVPVGIIGQASGSKPMDYFLDSARQDPYFLRPLIERHGQGAAAFLWYQGESDSFSDEATLAYPQKLKTLVESLRTLAANPEMMAGICQLGRYTWHKDDHFAAMREIQRQFVLQDPRAVLYSTLPYEVNKSDKIHLVTEGYIALGKQIGAQMVELERTGKAQTPGPVIKDAVLTDAKTITATFVNGTGLQGTASADEWFVTDDTRRGFKDGGFVPLEKIEIDSNGGRVLLHLAAAPVGQAQVSYGYRCDVGGSLTNSAGFPAACFVKVPVGKNN